ncbi:hypothetical protein JIG36_05825 [Actinoplanes sp. LDG1-06]|uniref:Uncharacterized protein n=1 Tax=Paractinoplanes ovalisporus TaxID=2810368 RepID=A0ABS2A5G9_9ACTN|nr:hypothetical protein [Actinoplanes ovalisporus]MBM2615078.1 hypothetical protein [Actinoplanes ovalisporus]
MRTARWALIGAGGLVMVYAIAGALTDPDVKGGALLFLIGVLVAHDGVLLPLTIGAGALAGRLVPMPVRTLVRAALLVSLAVTVVALPLVLGRGRAVDNPSLLPLPYGRGQLETYAVIWAATGVAALVAARRRRSAGPADDSRAGRRSRQPRSHKPPSPNG